MKTKGRGGKSSMKYFIALPLNSLKDKELYELRMSIIHQLKDAGHAVAYNVFEGDWWSEDKMKDRGVKNIKIHYLAKMVEELSKCDAVYMSPSACWTTAEDCTAYDVLMSVAEAYKIPVKSS